MATEQRLAIPFGRFRTGNRHRAQHAVSWLGGAPPARRGVAVELLLGPELVLGIDRMQPDRRARRDVERPGGAGGGGRAQLRLRLAARVALSLVAALRCHAAGLGRAVRDRQACPASCSRPPTIRLFVGVGLGLAFFP